MINIQDIRDGKLDGQYIWICDFRFKDFRNKPIRNVKPQKVLVRNNSELNKNKIIYYSSSHFIALNKKDEPIKSKVIGLFDNTGFRSYTGIAVNCFETEEECRKCYGKQLKIAIKGLENSVNNKTVELLIKELKEL